MPEFLTTAFGSDADIAFVDAAIRLCMALLLGSAVAFVYRWTRGRASDQRFIATLVLLTVLLTVTTIVIGNNVARAFSIVGALSIVRFRTIVEDTRDTAFVICAVAVGLAIGAGYLMVPALALVFVAAAAKLFSGDARRTSGTLRNAFTLHIRLAPLFTQREALQREIAAGTSQPTLIGIESVRSGSAVERSYEIDLAGESEADMLIERISTLEGVLSVEVKRILK